MITITARNQAKVISTPAQPPHYQLACHGCDWRQDEPKQYFIARALAWAHQQKVTFKSTHAVLFVPAEATARGNDGSTS